MTTDKTARWLDLIAFLLRHRYPVTREALFENVAAYRREEGTSSGAERRADASRRTFERDKRELRDLGITIETVEIPGAAHDEPQHGYRLADDAFYLPYLELTRPGQGGSDRPYRALRRVELSEDELALLDRATGRLAALRASPLTGPARWLRRKLAFDLPLPLSAVERVLAQPMDLEAARALDVLQQATAERVPVRCAYYSIGRDTASERTIEPWGLFFSWGRWYCVARDADKDARRVFRVDRMSAVRLAAEPADRSPPTDHHFTVPAAFSIQEYVGRAPWELSDAEPVTVRVRFAFPESRWVLAQQVGKPEDELDDDGGALIQFAVRDANPFLRWVLTFRDAAQVLAPDDVRERVETLRREVAAVYEPADGGREKGEKGERAEGP